MPVRIIFRGLILFSFPETGDDAGKLVARLINKPNIRRRRQDTTNDRPPHGPHEHRHDAQMHITTDEEGARREGARKAAAAQGQPPKETDVQGPPIDLAVGERVDITAFGAKDLPPGVPNVRPSASFISHVPRLSSIIAAGTPNVQEMAIPKDDLRPDPNLVRNIVTVDRGIVRARQMVTWDEGGFPLLGTEPAMEPAWPGFVKFVGSDVKGYVASEFVVDIDAVGVNVGRTTKDKQGKPHKHETQHQGRGALNHDVPYGMTDLLFTNYEYQDITALPYGMDFQWLFEAAGYPAVDLADGLNEWAGIAEAFNPDVYKHERQMLLDPVRTPAELEDYRMGRPFPYLIQDPFNPTKKGRLASTDEDYRPICIGGRD
jgi:hypothetical protein